MKEEWSKEEGTGRKRKEEEGRGRKKRKEEEGRVADLPCSSVPACCSPAQNNKVIKFDGIKK